MDITHVKLYTHNMYAYTHTFIHNIHTHNLYVSSVKPHHMYNILDITWGQGEAEAEC